MQRRLCQSTMVLWLLLLASCNFTPSTSRLARIEQGFFDKKDEYVTLYDMFVEDDKMTGLDCEFPGVRINDYYKSGDEWFDKHNDRSSLADALEDAGITQERYDLYRERMAAIHVEKINQDDNEVMFFKDSFGILDGWFIGIMNRPEEEMAEFVSLMDGTIVSDVHEIPTEEEGYYFLPLEGNWYLYYSMEY